MYIVPESSLGSAGFIEAKLLTCYIYIPIFCNFTTAMRKVPQAVKLLIFFEIVGANIAIRAIYMPLAVLHSVDH